MATTRSSVGAIAFTGRMANHAHDDMKSSSRDSLTAVATGSVPGVVTRANHLSTLLTPPNSISPGLNPRGLRLRSSPLTQATNLDPIESDLELHEDRASSVSSRGFDPSGAITPSLLATHHLPDILLNHGPLAIRHIMGYLTTSVPGFSGIPPTKARRIVVGALEGRGGSANGEGGIDGNVTFEKVGWGSWDARLRGQPPRQVSPISNTSGAGLPIKDATIRDRAHMAQSWAADSIAFSHSEDVDMAGHEADKMSLDGAESCSSSDLPSGDDLEMDDLEMTDDESWAAVGADALREQSYKAASSLPANRRPSVYNSSSYTITNHGGIAKPQFNYRSFSYQRPPVTYTKHNYAASKQTVTLSQQQERDAAEALLRLGSV